MNGKDNKNEKEVIILKNEISEDERKMTFIYMITFLNVLTVSK